MAESFFATLQVELLDRKTWTTRGELAQAIFEYIEGFYNPESRHSRLDYHSPVNTANATTPPSARWHDQQTQTVRETGGTPDPYDIAAERARKHAVAEFAFIAAVGLRMIRPLGGTEGWQLTSLPKASESKRQPPIEVDGRAVGVAAELAHSSTPRKRNRSETADDDIPTDAHGPSQG